MSPPPKNVEGSARLGPADTGVNSSTQSSPGEIDSRELLAGTDCVAIRHGEVLYWLRSTRQGKLLLTK